MTKEIFLTQNKVTLVDDSDYEYLNQWKWYYDNGYAVRNVRISKYKRVRERLHRLLMSNVEGINSLEVDHIDGNGLNNQRCNLRLVTKYQNQLNSKSKSDHYKGISWHSGTSRWRARITVNNKRISLGLYLDDVDAAKAYDDAARKYFGEYARTNF